LKGAAKHDLLGVIERINHLAEKYGAKVVAWSTSATLASPMLSSPSPKPTGKS
jgi:hypothetical protein